MLDVKRTIAVSTMLCSLSWSAWGQDGGPGCDCHLVECDANGGVVTSFWTPTPVQAVVKEGDSVANDTVFDRDMDVRVAMWVRADEFQAVEDAVGVDYDMDVNGDGWLLMDFNFSLFNRRQFNAGACSGFDTPVHQQALVIVASDARQADGVWPFYIPAGWSDAPVEVSSAIHYQPNSVILTEVAHDGDGGDPTFAFTGDLRSADGNTKVRLKLDYTGDLPFSDATVNLRNANIPLVNTQGTFTYCYPTRTRATVLAGDPNLSMSLQAAGGRICLPLENAAGGSVCLTPRKAPGGQVELARLQVIRYGGLECQTVPVPD